MRYEVKYRALNATTGLYEEVRRCYCSAPQYHGGWMEEEYCTVNVQEPDPVDFAIGDFITYRGEEYYINYDPTVVKKSRRKTRGDSFVYDNIRFSSLSESLKDVRFLDYVLYGNDSGETYTSLPKFSFFADSVEDLADRLKENLTRVFNGITWKVLTPNWQRTQTREGDVESIWTQYYDNDGSGSCGHWGTQVVTLGNRELNIDVEDLSCWDALKAAYGQFGLSYMFLGRGRIDNGGYILIGVPPVKVDKIFQYGKSKGLYEIERVSADDNIVTKLYAYGSTENLPTQYYANLCKSPYLKTIGDYAGGSTEYGLSVPLENVISYDVMTNVYYDNGVDIRHGNITASCGGVAIPAYAEVVKNATNITFRLLAAAEGATVPYPDLGNITYTTLANLNAFKAQLYIGVKVFITDGVNLNKFAIDHLDVDDMYPIGLSVNRLMLPGFPLQSLYDWVAANEPNLLDDYTFSQDRFTPWVKSNKDGIEREGVIYFDGGNDNKEIKPTIEGTGNDIVSTAQRITDNGILDEGDDNTFKMVVISTFNWEQIFSEATGDVTISMKDGYCVGRDFKLINVKPSTQTPNGTLYEFTLERYHDDVTGRWFPYSNGSISDAFQVMAGDHFVVTGIAMPKEYVEMASRKLLLAACNYLDKHDHLQYTYVPRIDEIEMARQHDRYLAGTDSVSLHDMIRAGMQMEFVDADLDITYCGYINSLTITEDGNNGIPTYEVVLKDETDESAIARMQGQISSLSNAVSNVSNSLSPEEISLAIRNLGGSLFLSKVNSDTASGLINFLAGLTSEQLATFLAGLSVGNGHGIDSEGNAILAALLSKNFQSGEQGSGFGVYTDGLGVSTAEVDKLIVRMKAVFQELEIKKKSFSAGDLGFSDAANTLLLVLPMNTSGSVAEGSDAITAYRCCWLMKDGEEAVSNDWHVDDQARCQTFNIKAGVYTNVSNRYYWRKVLEAGEGFEYDGVSYNYIDLAAEENGTYKGVSFEKGCQSGIVNDIPKAQDEVIQLGNQSDTDRQNYTEIIVNGQDAPAIKQYQGINDYTLSEKMVRGDYYDKVKGTYRSVVYGDFYAGDRTGDGGYAEYDRATNTFNVKGTLRVGSTLDDGRDVNELGTTKGNLLRNSGFTGNYESEAVTSSSNVGNETIIYSDPFDEWTQSGCTAIEDDLSASGMAAVIGTLQQTIEGGLVIGQWYTFSFRGKDGNVTLSVGGVTKTFSLTSSLERYDYPFVCVSNDPFILIGNGSEVMELQLMAGNLPSEWHASSKDNDKALAEYYANEYLRNAIVEASTTINGGLIMSQILKVGNYRNKQMSQETGGISGAYTDEKSPFLWGGGTMEQAIYTIMKYANNPAYQPTNVEVSQMAKFVVTHGGRAILNDIILRGYIYALGGVFNGTIYADKGVFNGLITNEWKTPQDADGQLTVIGAGQTDVYVMGREDLAIMCVMPIHSMQSPEVAIEIRLPVDEYYVGKEIKILSSVGTNAFSESFIDAVRVAVDTVNTENNYYLYGIEQYQVTIGSTTFTYFATDTITFDSGVMTLVGAPYNKTTVVDGETVVVKQTQWFLKSHTYRKKKNGQHGRGEITQQ